MACFRPVAPTIGKTHNLHPRFTRTHSTPTVFTPWGRELELSAKKIKIQKKSKLYLTFFRMLVTGWPGKISGISSRVAVVTIVTCFNFAEAFCFATGWPGASGDLGKSDGIQYVGDNDLCIDHLQHTEAEVIVEQMGSFEEYGAQFITVMITCSGELQWSIQSPHMSHRAALHGMPM